jgi:hypothetical protein
MLKPSHNLRTQQKQATCNKQIELSNQAIVRDQRRESKIVVIELKLVKIKLKALRGSTTCLLKLYIIFSMARRLAGRA